MGRAADFSLSAGNACTADQWSPLAKRSSTVADRHYVIDRGHVAETFDNATLLSDFDRISARLSA